MKTLKIGIAGYDRMKARTHGHCPWRAHATPRTLD